MNTTILVRYGEIALKGKNRRYFEEQLQQNITRALSGTESQVARKHGRFLVEGPSDKKNDIISRLEKVFGIVSVSAVHPSSLTIDEISKEAVKLLKNIPCQTFKVETRRANKGFPLTSPEVNRDVGAFVLHNMPGLKVDVHHPDAQVFIEIAADRAYLYSERAKGHGGLPVGVTGKALALLSGGIDSPVAAWMSMKRGLKLEAVHFHSFPFTGLHSQEKVLDLCRVLAGYCEELPLHLVSVTEIQKQLRALCPAELGVILLRRMMLRIAEHFCKQRNLQAIVTGESLGQVASQTLQSIDVIGSSTDTLLLRPLIALDKHEIVELAERIGTYTISIRPYEDCCTLFVPKHPATRPNIKQVERAESFLDTGKLIKEALSTAETVVISNSNKGPVIHP